MKESKKIVNRALELQRGTIRDYWDCIRQAQEELPAESARLMAGTSQCLKKHLPTNAALPLGRKLCIARKSKAKELFAEKELNQKAKIHGYERGYNLRGKGVSAILQRCDVAGFHSTAMCFLLGLSPTSTQDVEACSGLHRQWPQVRPALGQGRSLRSG